MDAKSFRQRTSKDPVCGMVMVDRQKKLVSEYAGRKYYFCCSGCKNSFETDPDFFLIGYHTVRVPEWHGVATFSPAAV